MATILPRLGTVASWHEHVRPAIWSVVLLTVIVGTLLYDRRPPFEYVSTQISPQIARAGGQIVIHRHVIWYRQCEGIAWTEIVGADRVITAYDRGTRSPYELGDVHASRIITLPQAMRQGEATYRGVIRFSRCGLTSRWWPIEVPYQEVSFEVR